MMPPLNIYKDVLLCMIMIICFALTKHVSPSPDFVWYGCADDIGNYTENSTYEKNLNLVLSDLITHASLSGFYNSTVGEGVDKVYALFYCRGDIESEDCHDCVQAAVLMAPSQCPSQKEAVIWYFQCTLRYANRLIFSQQEEDPFSEGYNPANVSKPNQLEQIISTTMDDAINSAAYITTLHGYATRVVYFTSSSNIYCLVQCTPDILGSPCEKCLKGALKRVRSGGPKAAFILTPSCQLMYDFDPFFSISYSPPTANGDTISFSLSRVALPIAAVVFFLCGLLIGYYLKARKMKSRTQAQYQIENSEQLQIERSDPSQFDFEIIQGATANFSNSNKLGEGGFGAVYRGKLPNSIEVAVKRLSINSGQGTKEFKTEVHLVAKLQHRNLVRLVGFCIKGEERLLIYELLPNSSLDRLLSDANRRANLLWQERYKIIAGIGRGLQYLHEDSRLKIVHRDLKSSNILLDEDMNPKIADFGMARLFKLDQTQANTSRVVGTLGYMAPEYMIAGKFSAKSDVYSFGVIALEIVSGQINAMSYQSPYSCDGLLHHAWRLWLKGEILDLVDSTLERNYPENELRRCIHIALLCVQEAAADRPTMPLVISMLSSSSYELPCPTPPTSFSLVLED